MSIRALFLASTIAFGLTSTANAQLTQGQTPMSGSSGQMAKAFELPEACRTAAKPGGGGDQMKQTMHGGMSQNMQSGMQGMMGQMTDAQKGYHEAMMRMDPPMMMGMMAKDADVAWACSMIPHHQGAVEMSRVVLRTGDNAEVKKMAEKVISDQEKEIAELTAWIEKNAAREGKN